MNKPLSSILRRPSVTERPLAHSAIVQVVGWADVNPRGEFFVGPVQVLELPPQWLGQRVRASLYPSPYGSTYDVLGICRVARLRAAHPTECNSNRFKIVGHLLRAESYLQRLAVAVFPQTKGLPRFLIQTRTTQAAIAACDPAWTGVKITGSLLDRLLLAEEIQPVYAPIASHWKYWKRPKKRIKTAEKVAVPESWEKTVQELKHEGPKTYEAWEESVKKVFH